MKPSPTTIRMNPAISFCARFEKRLPIAAAPAPSRTKTIVNPRTNGMLARTTRAAVPGSPSRRASTAETADR